MGFRHRLLVLFLAVGGALACVWVRVFQLQVLSGDRWKIEAANQRVKRTTVGGLRGRILDAEGEVLAQDQAVVHLVFVPGEWATRERFRCTKCGAVSFQRTPRFFDREGAQAPAPRRCTCGATRESFEALPPQDLAPLETELNLPPGALSSLAEERMADLAEKIDAAVVEGVLGLKVGTLRREAKAAGVSYPEAIERHRPELEGHEFRAEDLRKSKRADWYSRTFPVTSWTSTSTGETTSLKSIGDGAERLMELDVDGRYRGFHAEAAIERSYPKHALLAQCVGYVGPFRSRAEYETFKDQYGADEILPDLRVGRLGLEAHYDDELRGSPGTLRTERDEDGLFTRRTVEEAPRRGRDLKLYLGSKACLAARQALLSEATDVGYAPGGAASGAMVVMDETGAIVAWAETPSFDPNGNVQEISKRLDEEEEQQDAVENDDPAARLASKVLPRPGILLSRVARVPVEPGSSMKLVTVMALLSSGHALPENYHCIGPKQSERDPPPKCHHHPDVGPEGALVYSCNRWCADCASASEWRGLHRRLFPEWAARFGIGKSPGLDYPSCAHGEYWEQPDVGQLRQLSIGQSMRATPLQMARVVALLANGTTLPFPRLAETIGDEPVLGGGVPVTLDPGALARVRAGMKGCVDIGTAKDAFKDVQLSGVTVYGKTGTASVSGLDWLQQGDAEMKGGPWHLWFVGYAVKPGARTLVFSVVLHSRAEGQGGGPAARVAARFLSWWYGR